MATRQPYGRAQAGLHGLFGGLSDGLGQILAQRRAQESSDRTLAREEAYRRFGDEEKRRDEQRKEKESIIPKLLKTLHDTQTLGDLQTPQELNPDIIKAGGQSLDENPSPPNFFQGSSNARVPLDFKGENFQEGTQSGMPSDFANPITGQVQKALLGRQQTLLRNQKPELIGKGQNDEGAPTETMGMPNPFVPNGVLDPPQQSTRAMGPTTQQKGDAESKLEGILRPSKVATTGAEKQAGLDVENAPQNVAAADTKRTKESNAVLGREKELEKFRRSLGPPPGQVDARTDRSYNLSTATIDKLRKPLMDQADRLGRLQGALKQMTPAADALIAPELLTAMAGGQGSGLRMNEAEISRIVGGRSKLESLRATLNQYQLDPSKALSVTPEQRKQMRMLAAGVMQENTRRQAVLNQAAQQLIGAKDVNEHRSITEGVYHQLGMQPPTLTLTPDGQLAPAGGQ